MLRKKLQTVYEAHGSIGERQLRSLIREEFMQGVPDFALRQATESYMADVRKRVIVSLRSSVNSPKELREATARLNSCLEQLADEVQGLLQDRLFAYMRNT